MTTDARIEPMVGAAPIVDGKYYTVLAYSQATGLSLVQCYQRMKSKTLPMILIDGIHRLELELNG